MTHLAPSSPSLVPRKNPLLRTPQMNLPPEGRSRIAHGLTEAAAIGAGLRLQCCADCGTTQYPPQTTCVKCLSAKVRWTRQSGLGELLTSTTLEHSNHLYFKERLPWRIGSVRLDNGPCVIAFLTDSVTETSPRVRLSLRLDRAGQAVVIAQPESEQDMHPQEKLQKETGCSPDHRKVLVTDGKSLVGQALVRALLKAGADTVWVGHAEPWRPLPGVAEIAQLPRVEMVPLDVTDPISVTRLGAEIGHKVDILINNAEVHRTHGISSRRGTEIARAEMEINYLGLLRLAQAFGPALQGRAADGSAHAVAWVNMLSVFALSNFPAQGTYSASKAAALSLAQCLRSDMLSHGIRVLNVFPGPVDDEWNQNLPPPKLAPASLADATVKALINGVEDLFPGDVAQEWFARWRDNPKALERELAQGAL
jgi:NAD(P)-dependent dehydrogenase (short-subunit alcohol dehydrogenase family)/uncharacterized OB-fold protein